MMLVYRCQACGWMESLTNAPAVLKEGEHWGSSTHREWSQNMQAEEEVVTIFCKACSLEPDILGICRKCDRAAWIDLNGSGDTTCMCGSKIFGAPMISNGTVFVWDER